MPDDTWRPLSVREKGTAEAWDAPVEGIPLWLRQGIFDWLQARYWDQVERAFNKEALRFTEQKLRTPLVWSTGGAGAYKSLLIRCADDEQFFLDLIDFVLWLIKGSERPANELRRMLENGGSVWTVAPDRTGLSRRVLPEASLAATQVVSTGSRAGVLIGKAWRHVYGRNPDPSTGYREAVRAVEAAACHVVLPTSERATLGTVIAALRDAPEGKYATVFPTEAAGGNPLEAVKKLMELVWTSQLDRHGTAAEEVPLSVSQEQAEAALHAAVTLIHWFHRGFVRLAL